MKIILIENVDRLGNMGDLVNVKDGYARNYLIPRNLAKPATPGNMKILESLKKKQQEEDARLLAQAKALAEKVSSLSLTIPAQAGEEEKLFGSISNELIAAGLAEEGVNIDKRDILIDEPIKKLGVYQVTVKIAPDVKASLRVWIVKK
jgi:large subunit ribosomal protein L9